MKLKKILCEVLALTLIISTMGLPVFAESEALPNASVMDLGDITLNDYRIWDGSNLNSGGDPIDLQVAMEFIANDTAEEAEKNYYGKHITDFFITIKGMENGSFDAKDCYLAGNYGEFGWIKVPLDGMTIEDGKTYPVITSVGFNFSYIDICDIVKDFKCGIYLSDKVIEENPDMEVTLALGLSENVEKAKAAEFVEVDSYNYPVRDFGMVVQLYRASAMARSEGLIYVDSFASLEEALAAAENGDTIKVIKDIELEEGIVVEKEITLDLNGYTISMKTDEAKGSSLITNRGILTVTDETGNGRITTCATNPDTNPVPSYANNTVTNYGVLNVMGGAIENTTDASGRASYAIDNNSTSASAVVNISGGRVLAARAIRQFANSTTNKNTVNITGGAVAGSSYALWTQNPGSGDPVATLNISGDADVSKILVSPSAEFEVSISGGTISEVAIWEADTTNTDRNPSGFITGGTFATDVSEYVADGYELNENGTVTEAAPSGVAAIGSTGYETLQAAYNAAEEGDTIELLADVKVTGKFAIEKAVTIDGNGHSIIADETATWYTVSGKLNIKNYKTHLVGINSDNVTLKDIVLDNNNNAAGINVYCSQNVVFDNVSIVNATKGMAALTVNGSTVTFKTKFDALGNSVAIDISTGSGVTSTPGITVEKDTVFNLADKTVKFVNGAVIDVSSAVTAESKPYFVAKDVAYYYTANQINSRTTAFSNGLTLLFDMEVTKAITVKGTLDLNGNTLTVSEDIALPVSSNIKVVNGTVEGKFNVKSATATIASDETLDVITDLEGYTVVHENGVYAVKEASYVAQVGDVKYGSLDEAVATGGEVALLADIELANTITVENDVSLDLNGYTISGTCNASQAQLFIVNNGATMTIKDSSAEKTGKITYAGDNSTGWIVDVEGKLVLESGTLELTGTWNIGYAVDVRPNSWGTEYTEATTFVMNGGKIVSSDGGVRVASSSADAHKLVSASFTMNGGEIDAAWDGVFVQQSNTAWDVLNVTINNGTIKSGLNPVRFYGPAATSYVNGEDCVDIALNGGTLTYTGTEVLEWLVDSILRIGGGVTAEDFIKDSSVTASAGFAEAKTAEGYKWIESNGVYTLVEAPAEDINVLTRVRYYIDYMPISFYPENIVLYRLGLYAAAESDNYDEYGFEITVDGQDPVLIKAEKYSSALNIVVGDRVDKFVASDFNTNGGNNVCIFGQTVAFRDDALGNEKITYRPYIKKGGNVYFGRVSTAPNIYKK